MKLNSKYFDCIRVKPDEDLLQREEHPTCDWKGCSNPALHRAPMGRGREGKFFKFCMDHVRAYNKSYNYFDGMSDDEVAGFQKAAATGHRPTWSMGTHAPGSGGKNDKANPSGFMHGFDVDDAYGFFGADEKNQRSRDRSPARPIRNVERRCLKALDLDADAAPHEIKTRYKDLVKRHHPDRNGGDRRSEDKLREVLQAYNYLRQAGLC